MKSFTLGILIKNTPIFIKIISQHYPISVHLLEKYEKHWDWQNIASNTSIAWTVSLMEKFQNKLFAKELPHNTPIIWSVPLIERFIKQKKITWESLMWQDGVLDSPETTALCLFEWSKGKKGLMHPQFNDETDIRNYRYIQFNSWGKDAPLWAADVVENTPNLHWNLFSGVEGFPWTIHFIEKHQNQLDWNILSYNNKIPWTPEFIEKYQNKLNWRGLSYNHGVPWNSELLKKFSEKINWYCLLEILLGSDSLRTPLISLQEIIKNIPEKIEWAYPDIDHGYWEGTLSGIINREDIYWTPEFFYSIQPHIEKFFTELAETSFDDWGNGNWFIDTLDDNGNTAYWTYFARTNNWSPEFFELMLEKQNTENITTINWEYICAFAKHLWTPKFIEAHQKKLLQYFESSCFSGWTLPANRYFPWNEYFHQFEPHFTKRSFQDISTNPAFSLSITFIEEHQEKLEWGFNGMETRNDLTEDIINRFMDKWDWDVIARKGRIPIQILQKFPEKVNWKIVSRRDDLNLEEMDLSLPWDWEEFFRNNSTDLTHHLPEDLIILFLENL